MDLNIRLSSSFINNIISRMKTCSRVLFVFLDWNNMGVNKTEIAIHQIDIA
jgi:hypothetical protein